MPPLHGTPADLSSADDVQWIEVPINRSFSDGDKSTWPTDPKYGRPDDSLYREKLAKMWLQKRDEYEPGENYILDSLPEGYVLFDRPRPKNPEIRDKYLWGHPSGAVFNSPNRFFPHFYYLMTGGTTQCPCDLCTNQTKKMLSFKAKEGAGAHGGYKARGRAHTTSRVPVDPEGTPDVFKMAVLRLKEKGMSDEIITEPASMDWRAERKKLQIHLVKLNMQNSFIPRAGELVLWTPSMEGELVFDEESACFQMYSRKDEKFLGIPNWRAGTVGQTPEEPVVLEDLVQTTKKTWAVNYSGFRVETFPDPNSDDKSYSLQYKYVHLNCIRPLNYWQLFLHGIPEDKLHPSIKYALTVMSSFSLLDKYRFKGVWPNASIYCRGIYIGAELLIVGDAVRIKPPGYDPDHPVEVTDVMVIKNIRFELINCVDDPNLLAEKHVVRLEGKVYTLSPERAYRAPGMAGPPQPLTHEEVINAFEYVGMRGYGNWYYLHPPEANMEISQDMVIGRCYEPDAMRLLFDDTSLGLDLDGVLSGRDYSRRTDERIPPGKHWFWGDYRTQSLALDSLNGEDVGKYSEARDPKMWRANLKIIDGTATPADVRDARLPRDIGRPLAGKKESSFAEVGKTSKLVSSGLGAAESTNVSSADEGPAENETSDEDEEGEKGDGTDSSDDLAFLHEVPYFRGGTEETEGGDYTPGHERKPAKRQKQGR
ncbi:hypothetical protein VTN02DRAFT_4240 [Thermoascus thermophilus]